MRAALVHPVVLEAATACGAVHRRFNLGISKEAFEYCEYSLKMHSRALRSLKELESNAGPYDREAITISWFCLVYLRHSRFTMSSVQRTLIAL